MPVERLLSLSLSSLFCVSLSKAEEEGSQPISCCALGCWAAALLRCYAAAAAAGALLLLLQLPLRC